MGMVVRTNAMAINANRQLGMNNSQVSKSLEKLSSGFKINRAGDDASGLAISEKMKAQIKGLEQASANSQDGISLVQTAEGALTEVHSMLNRMVELATKSANGTIQDEVDRENIQNEINALTSEINRIGDSTNFNGIKLLDGTLGMGGGTTGAKGAANVVIDPLMGDKLKDVAATKTKSEFSIGQAVAIGKTGSFTFDYVDDKGSNKSVNIELRPGAGTGDINYRINGGEWQQSGVAAGSGATTPPTTASALQKALSESDMGKLFDISVTNLSKLTFENKVAGASKAEVKLASYTKDITSSTLGNSGEVLKDPLTAVKGADQYHSLDVSGFGLYDGSDATANNIITVNGKKFAFVKNGMDTAQYSPDITTVAIASLIGSNPVAADVTEMVKKINESFGSGTASNTNALGATTTIEFHPVAGKATAGNGGLTLQIGDTNDDFNKVTVSVDDMRADALGVGAIDVSTQDAAGDQIDIIKKAINQVSMNRGNLGALQNRLEYTINNLDVSAENMTAANSRIRDTDMAKEMMNYTKMNVLVQSAQAMLAQANQQPQSILQLLQ